jgi:membrane-associated phospholipid phosphatase
MALFLLLTALITFVDVQPIGPNDSLVGFGTINSYFFNLFGENTLLFAISDYMRILGLVIAVIFAGIGIYQWIKRKHLEKVDSDIFVLGATYLVCIAFYVLFELLDINYRPILVNGQFEASYPSSAVLIIWVVVPTTIVELFRMCKIKWLNITLSVVLIGIGIFVFLGRLISGGHWFTDVIAGLILAFSIFFAFMGTKTLVDKKKRTITYQI